MRDPKSRDRDLEAYDTNPWRENHGNLLLAFAAILCLIGATILACRQAQFSPVRFPSKLSPQVPQEDTDSTADSAKSPSKPNIRTVTLQIYGAASDEGMMKIAVYTRPEDFNDPQRAFEVDTWKIVEGICGGLWEVPQELNKVAIAVYHDANNNGELDRNPLGIPSERYGYSNNARGLTGPPSFEEAAIVLGDKPVEISIR